MFTFEKEERLCSIKLIDQLFAGSKSFVTYPFRIVWFITPLKTENFPAQICISVSKRNYKRSNKRNLIKRRIREAYRKNKSIIYNYLETNNLQIAFMVIFLSKTMIDYQGIENKLIQTLNNFVVEIERNKEESFVK